MWENRDEAEVSHENVQKIWNEILQERVSLISEKCLVLNLPKKIITRLSMARTFLSLGRVEEAKAHCVLAHEWIAQIYDKNLGNTALLEIAAHFRFVYTGFQDRFSAIRSLEMEIFGNPFRFNAPGFPPPPPPPPPPETEGGIDLLPPEDPEDPEK